MSHSFYLAGWASLQEKFLDFELRSGLNILYQSYKISPPSPLLLTQKSQPATHTHPHPPTIRSGPKLSDKLSAIFWFLRLAARVQAKTLRAPLNKFTQIHWSFNLFVPKLIMLLAGCLDQRT